MKKNIIFVFFFIIIFYLFFLGSGKTQAFRETILPQLRCPGGVYIVTSDPRDFQGITNVNYLPTDYTLSQTELQQLPSDSCLFFDDFVKTSVSLNRAINYCARHFRITIILVVHALNKVSPLFKALKKCDFCFFFRRGCSRKSLPRPIFSSPTRSTLTSI